MIFLYRFVFSGSTGSSIFLLNNIKKKLFLLFIFSGLDFFYKKRLNFNLVKIFCKKNNILNFQYKLIFINNYFNNYNYYIYKNIRNKNYSVMIIFDYGFLFSLNFFNNKKIILFNIHCSILPKWRGSSPIKYSLIYYDLYTGFSVIFIKKFFDNGRIFYFYKLPVKFFYNYFILKKKLLLIISIEVFKFLVIYLRINKVISFNQSNINVFYSLKE